MLRSAASSICDPNRQSGGVEWRGSPDDFIHNLLRCLLDLNQMLRTAE